MSYLLDALRKSELERRVGQVPELNPAMPPQPAPKRRNRMILLIFALLAINIVTLIYITFFNQPAAVAVSPVKNAEKAVPDPVRNPAKVDFDFSGKRQPTTSPSNTPVKVATAEKDSSAKINSNPSARSNFPDSRPISQSKPDRPKNPVDGRAEVKPVKNSIPVTSPPVKSDTTVKPRSRPESIAKRPEFTSEVKTTATPPTPMNDRQSNRVAKVEPPNPFNVSGSTKKIDPVKPTPVPSLPESVEPERKNSIGDSNKSPPTRPSPAIPLLAGMPRDFQRQVPSLNINVFVYSEIPAERFVIIDMNKYVPGQVTSDGQELIDILPDSLVLKYRGQKYRVHRP